MFYQYHIPLEQHFDSIEQVFDGKIMYDCFSDIHHLGFGGLPGLENKKCPPANGFGLKPPGLEIWPGLQRPMQK